MKKKTLGNNPLEAYFASAAAESDQCDEKLMAEQSESCKKQRITIHLPIDLIERIKNVVYWEPGLTLTGFAQEAFEDAVKKIEAKRGSVYPERKDRLLKGGRPLV